MIESLSFITALRYALSNIAVRKGLAFGSNSTTAVIVSLTVTFLVFLTLLIIFYPLQVWSVRSLPYFLAAGVLAPGLFRFFLYSAISRIGVSLSSTATNSFPLIVSMISVAFFDEKLTPLKMLGMCLTMGAAFLAVPKNEKQGFDFRMLRNRGFLLGVAAAAVRGGSEVLRKAGLLVFNAPIFGAAIGTTGGFLFSLALLAASGSTRSALTYEKRSFLCFVLSTVFVIAAWIIGFYALFYGEVVRVTPIMETVPLITVLLSAVFLRGLEQITQRVVLASLLAVMGVAFLRLGS